ncbi:Stemmadenine O-acetyltransferase [Linum perenne]
MEVFIVSEESVKPSKSQTLEPLKLNLLDQLTPASYFPIILFYLNNPNHHNLASQLKQSLSETLSIYYPMSGRIRDNYEIHDFHKGVPFIETRVKCKLENFLRDQGLHNDRVEMLNNLLPRRTERLVQDTGPQVVVQMNVFECGGLALGMCFLHKTHDGAIMSSFVRTWSTINNNNNNINEDLLPNFSEGQLNFPPVKSLPAHKILQSEDLWFTSNGVPATRRFVFDADSILKLRLKAKSKTLNNPTRSDALSAFIWKCIITSFATSTNKGNNYRPSFFATTLNLREKTRLDLSPHSFGNMIFSTDSKYDPEVNGEPTIDNLAMLVRDGVSTMNHEFLKKLTGQNGSRAIFDLFGKHAEEEEEEDASVLDLSCLYEFGLIKTDFGWGPAVWVGFSGPGSSGKEDQGIKYTLNRGLLVENNKGGIEAWLTLEESLMKALERNQEFIEFASVKSSIVP